MEDMIDRIMIFVLSVFVLSLMMSFPLFLVWNWVAPLVFGIRDIEFLESWALSAILAALLALVRNRGE